MVLVIFLSESVVVFSSPTVHLEYIPFYDIQVFFLKFIYFWLHWVFAVAGGIFFIYLFIYFWLRWVFCCYAWAFSSCGERGLLFVAVRGLLIAVASLVAEYGP